MTNQKKALIITLKYLGIILLVVASLLILEIIIGPKLLTLGICIGLSGFFTWLMYSAILSKIEMDEKFDAKRETTND